jgi:hypothetical protein
VHKNRFIILGIAIGILAEIGSLVAAFYGTNLFHGGRPNNIANALLPGIGIVEHLSSNVPQIIPKFLLIISVFQFPVYGILAGIDYPKKALSRITIGMILLHLSGSVVAYYGMALDNQWRKDSEKYGACIRANAAAEEVTNNSSRIINLVKWIEQSKKRLERLQAEKNNGVVFSPDPEPSLINNLDKQQRELEQRWQFYKDAGGPAKSPEEVSIIPSPCGKAPSKPTLF